MIVKTLDPKNGHLMLTGTQRADEQHRVDLYNRRPECIALSAGYLEVLTRLECGGGVRPADAVEKVKTYDRPALQKLFNELNARDAKQVLEDKYINHMDALRTFEAILLHEPRGKKSKSSEAWLRLANKSRFILVGPYLCRRPSRSRERGERRLEFRLSTRLIYSHACTRMRAITSRPLEGGHAAMTD